MIACGACGNIDIYDRIHPIFVHVIAWALAAVAYLASASSSDDAGG
jgi:hypothetical protein